jgi:hypothetical protein
MSKEVLIILGTYNNALVGHCGFVRGHTVIKANEKSRSLCILNSN